MMELQYVQAQPSDVEVILSMCLELVRKYEDLTLIDYDRVSEWLRRKVEQNISGYTCVFCNGKEVAYYCLSPQNEGTELDDFYVLPQFRGKGIGSQILKKCSAEAEKPLFLYVFTENIGAMKLYQRCGFSVTEQVSPTRVIMTCCT